MRPTKTRTDSFLMLVQCMCLSLLLTFDLSYMLVSLLSFVGLFFFPSSDVTQEFYLFLSAKDIALVANFTASHDGFTLPLTVPQLYK